jgi:hypothetical protein
MEQPGVIGNRWNWENKLQHAPDMRLPDLHLIYVFVAKQNGSQRWTPKGQYEYTHI